MNQTSWSLLKQPQRTWKIQWEEWKYVKEMFVRVAKTILSLWNQRNTFDNIREMQYNILWLFLLPPVLESSVLTMKSWEINSELTNWLSAPLFSISRLWMPPQCREMQNSKLSNLQIQNLHAAAIPCGKLSKEVLPFFLESDLFQDFSVFWSSDLFYIWIFILKHWFCGSAVRFKISVFL